MEIADEIEFLHRVIDGAFSAEAVQNALFDRMLKLGLVSLLDDISNQLEDLNKKLDKGITLEAIRIDFGTYLNRDYWTKNRLFADNEKHCKNKEHVLNHHKTYTNEINLLTGNFPQDVPGYSFNSDKANHVKLAMHQLCDDECMDCRDVDYSLNAAFKRMMRLMEEASRKVRKPKPCQYVALWAEISGKYDNKVSKKEYDELIEENSRLSFSELVSYQKQIIFKVIASGFFRFARKPTGAEVKKTRLIISEDDLEVGTEIPANIVLECAKVERFFDWKEDDIIVLNYEKLGQYINKNYYQLDKNECFYIVDFDRKLDAVHVDMARIKPKLAQYTKNYEGNLVGAITKDCVGILNTCKGFLAEGIRDSFLVDLLYKILYDDKLKVDVRKMLSSQSKITYICNMIASLRWFNVFRPEINSQDLAESIHANMYNVKVCTIKRYIDNSYNSRDGDFYEWCKANIEDLKAKPFNPLLV